MEVAGSKKVPIVGLDDKRQITAVFAGTSLKLFPVVFQVASRLVCVVTANYEMSSKTATCFTL